MFSTLYEFVSKASPEAYLITALLLAFGLYVAYKGYRAYKAYESYKAYSDDHASYLAYCTRLTLGYITRVIHRSLCYLTSYTDRISKRLYVDTPKSH